MEWFERIRMPHRRRLEGLLSLVVVLLALRFLLDVQHLTIAAAAVAFLALASLHLSPSPPRRGGASRASWGAWSPGSS